MIKHYSYGDIDWYDLESPTQDEIRRLALIYKLDPEVEEELLTPTLRPKVDGYEKYLYVILHFPGLRPTVKDSSREIDFVIGEKFLITTHYESLDPLHRFVDIFGSENSFQAKKRKTNAGHIFFDMIQHLYRSLGSELEALGNVLLKAEKNLFQGNEKGMLIGLSKINRDLLDFKGATNLHKSILESFEEESVRFFGKEYEQFAREILNEFYKIHSAIQDSKDFLEELRRTNDSLLSNKQNEIMKTVTVLAFIFLPLSLIASIFGMNIDDMPIVGQPHSFALITGGMVALALIVLLIARHNEWL